MRAKQSMPPSLSHTTRDVDDSEHMPDTQRQAVSLSWSSSCSSSCSLACLLWFPPANRRSLGFSEDLFQEIKSGQTTQKDYSEKGTKINGLGRWTQTDSTVCQRANFTFLLVTTASAEVAAFGINARPYIRKESIASVADLLTICRVQEINFFCDSLL